VRRLFRVFAGLVLLRSEIRPWWVSMTPSVTHNPQISAALNGRWSSTGRACSPGSCGSQCTRQRKSILILFDQSCARMSSREKCLQVKVERTRFCLPPPPMIGCPILRALGEGWDKQNLRGKGLGGRAVVSHPSPRARRMGHPIIGGGGWSVTSQKGAFERCGMRGLL
jgi:hypothetical protein